MTARLQGRCYTLLALETPMFTLFFVFLGLLLPAARAEEPYAMNDIGGSLSLPKGWEMTEWADWSFKAKSPDGVLFRLYLTPFQVPASDEAAREHAITYQERVDKEGGGAFQPARTRVARLRLASGEVEGTRADLDFTFERQGEKGVLHAAAFPVKGQVAHFEVISLARNDKKAEAALDGLLAAFRLEKGPEPVITDRVETASGFAFAPPPGWRAPLPSELEAVRRMAAKVGEQTLDPKRCAVALRPPARGEPDVLFGCELYKHLGIVDEYSFDAIEAELHQEFFGTASKPVEKARQARFGDRLGFLYAPPVAGHPVRMGIAPYDKGVVLLWAMGQHLDDAALDKAVEAALASFQFTGPDGGAPIVAIDKRIAYYLRHRPTSPFVLGPALLLIAAVGGGVALARKKKPAAVED